MNTYKVALQQAANEDFESLLPVRLAEFQITAESIILAARKASVLLNNYMSGGSDEYVLDDATHGSLEMWFGDEDTNQDVMFSITQI